ncbi:hypothetical protein EJB05_27006 [Eragrostis curvula]|uniref:Uncharacterized protein n=1 Tax=Eragrostis curvula TaxID=38414 RepID=A0A5J9UMS9_9POAL|nr:hypothetical protein EJB05_27006 [Eragrostis curvula]
MAPLSTALDDSRSRRTPVAPSAMLQRRRAPSSFMQLGDATEALKEMATLLLHVKEKVHKDSRKKAEAISW